MRVMIVSPTFGGYGGMEAFAFGLLRQARPLAEFEVTLCFKRVRGFALQPALQAAVAPERDRVAWVERASAGLVRAIARADIVHAFNATPDVVALTRSLGRKLLVNVINHRVPGRSLHQRAWDFCLRRAHRRFYISEFVRRTWEGETRWSRSEVVFPICELASDPGPVAQRRGFVFAARWVENKGLETLVEAYAQAKLDPVAWPLVLIGDGPLRERVERRIRELDAQGIETPGFLPQEQKAAAIRSARWMVVPPQTNEDFGLTAIEARNLGVPCIATRDGGVPEAAGAEALLCKPGSVSELAACLRAASAMSAEEYAGRAERTRRTLQTELVGADFYANAYRELATQR